MNTVTSVDDIYELFAARGSEAYGERVTSMEHALQCAHLARQSGASDELVIAALLHDLGHLVADAQGSARFDLAVDDDDHEAVGGRLLARLFGPAVAQPVALHVTAKRWRCTVQPDYHDALSDTSRATLKAQGGLLTEEECRRFEAHPGFAKALALRDWDDLAKEMDVDCPDLASYRPLLEKVATSS
jgi:phosphonate degradation associated HDIG domain protein